MAKFRKKPVVIEAVNEGFSDPKIVISSNTILKLEELEQLEK